MGKKDDPSLMHQWFKLVQEKNALVRYESELMILWVSTVWMLNNLNCVDWSGIVWLHQVVHKCSASRFGLVLFAMCSSVWFVFSARELELEDRQSRLQQELREHMAVDG